ncbi:MAG: ribosomal protein S18-alanine N-acetyltransferase [Deltaproteobacteria bacterium]|nr:ribosomal protein S18-alanine N-acetyltransferase [Deltaproteobacteria bacterium]
MLETDVQRVMEVERAAFAHPWSEEMIRRELEHEFSTVLLAIRGREGPIAGFAVVWLVHDELHVLNVAVAPEARRSGVARRILDRVESRAREQGARVSMLEVRRSNQPAIALYRSLGYREVGVRPGYYAEDGEDALVMDKAL